MNLYMISLGGKVKGCNLEVHDVQFVAANQIDETVEILKEKWYGDPEKLHMDSYKLIHGVEGHTVLLTQQKPDSGKQLYFVHLGGYKKASTQELHEVSLLIGDSEQEVKEKALREFHMADIENHVDSIILVEACIHSTDGKTYYVEISESSECFDQGPDWFGYRRLDIAQTL